MSVNAPRSARLRPSGYLIGAFCIFAVLFLLSGCGITVGNGPAETEIFKRLTIEGEDGVLTAGAPLTLILEYEQPYPERISVDCDLLAGDSNTGVLATPTPEGPQPGQRARVNKIKDILVLRLTENPPENLPEVVDESLVDEATPVADTREHIFLAPDMPGRYVVECFTQEDDNNFIRRAITISPAPALPATPELTATP